MVMPMASGHGLAANRAGGYYFVQPIVFLDILGRNSLAESERLYIFTHTWFMGFAFIGIGVFETAGTTVDALIVLVDERNETVMRYFFFDG